MLTEVCDFVHNYFENVIYSGQHEISNGQILDDDVVLLDGQRFRVKGSALNDGIYTYHESGIFNDDNTEFVPLADETFVGDIVTMKIPTMFLTLVLQITDWVAENAKVLNSPLQSESFGGYAYTKATGSAANGGMLGWQDVFRARLKAYRKIG